MIRSVILIAILAAFVSVECKNLQNEVKSVLQKHLQRSLEQVKLQGSGNLKDLDPNDYVDTVLEDFKEYVDENNLDPYKVEDIDFLGLWTRGYIAGFSTITRIGDATVTYDTVTLTLDVNLGIYMLEGDFNWTYTFLGLTYNGQADAMVDEVNFNLKAHGDCFPGWNYTTLNVDSTDVYYIGRISVEVTGFGIFDVLIDVISEIVIALMTDIIPGIINDVVAVVFQIIFEAVPCPIPSEPIPAKLIL